MSNESDLHSLSWSLPDKELLAWDREEFINSVVEYFEQSLLEEDLTLNLFSDAVDYAESVVNKLEISGIKIRIKKLENPVSMGFLQSAFELVLLGLGGLAVKQILKVTLGQLLSHRLLLGTVKVSGRIQGNSASAGLAKKIGLKQNKKHSFFTYKTYATEVNLDPNSIESYLLENVPDFVADVATDVAGGSSKPSKPQKSLKYLSVTDFYLSQKSDITKQIREIKSASSKAKLQLKNLLTSKNDSPNNRLLVIHLIKINLEFKKQYENINPKFEVDDIVKISAQPLIIGAIFLSNLYREITILPPQNEKWTVERGSFGESVGYISQVKLPERLSASKFEIQMILQISKIIHVSTELKKGELVTYFDKYSKKSRPEFEIVKYFNSILRKSREDDFKKSLKKGLHYYVLMRRAFPF